ncbi:hypothetical protein [Nocardia sp. NRRL S-836]|uniref:hypothetical protein n=1 Tax=Nocardia sp. NRRL S-836 TaxID=1519492 RepID=UPI0006AE8258|nr:hypothetical protein [Nocardia sp. NRRL S-836]
MSPKKNDPVAPPPVDGEWHIRFGTAEAAKGWQELENRAAANLRRAWDAMRTDPGPVQQTGRHERLKGSLSTGVRGGQVMARWQIEVTGGDRVWYLLDVEKHTVWIDYAGAHPKATE